MTVYIVRGAFYGIVGVYGDRTKAQWVVDIEPKHRFIQEWKVQ